jgi:2-keto-myo-inositol isomerase
MLPKALNHMTVARLSFRALLDTAATSGCVGIEVRNDLPQALFDGMDPAAAGDLARSRGLRILALAEVKRFDDWSAEKAVEARALMQTAQACGAEAVSLIPRNDNPGLGRDERQARLRMALRDLAPMLADHGLIGLIEPLGFESCPLRHKAEAVEAIVALGAAGRFKLVHDTFHHHLAGGGPVIAEHTGLVHISGVIDPDLAANEMGDQHRVLVGPGDRLGNLDQIANLEAAGYVGPISFEAFSPEIHALADPGRAIATSFEFIRTHQAAKAA